MLFNKHIYSFDKAVDWLKTHQINYITDYEADDFIYFRLHPMFWGLLKHEDFYIGIKATYILVRPDDSRIKPDCFHTRVLI